MAIHHLAGLYHEISIPRAWAVLHLHIPFNSTPIRNHTLTYNHLPMSLCRWYENSPITSPPKPGLFRCAKEDCQHLSFKDERTLKRHHDSKHSGALYVCRCGYPNGRKDVYLKHIDKENCSADRNLLLYLKLHLEPKSGERIFSFSSLPPHSPGWSDGEGQFYSVSGAGFPVPQSKPLSTESGIRKVDDFGGISVLWVHCDDWSTADDVINV
ncbi:60S ribosomal protein L32 [Fusarium oxysporum f. sp. albedinis]|nr:60S ribosomal protein L32 [Fusarium oxysporum f. sp. albedinis]